MGLGLHPLSFRPYEWPKLIPIVKAGARNKDHPSIKGRLADSEDQAQKGSRVFWYLLPLNFPTSPGYVWQNRGGPIRVLR